MNIITKFYIIIILLWISIIYVCFFFTENIWQYIIVGLLLGTIKLFNDFIKTIKEMYEE